MNPFQYKLVDPEKDTYQISVGSIHYALCSDRQSAELVCAALNRAQSEIQALQNEPTITTIQNACMWFRHDFGLKNSEEQAQIMFEGREWLRAWLKAFKIL